MFGEYQEKLLEDYHIFAIEGSYGTGDYTEDRMIGRMHYYGTESMEHENNRNSVSHRYGRSRLSVNRFLEYMESRYGISLVQKYTGLTSKWEEENIRGNNMEEKESTILDEYEKLKESAPDSSEEGSSETETGAEEEQPEGSPFTCLEQIEKNGLLSVVMPENMELSGMEIDSDQQASNRSLNTGRGSFSGETVNRRHRRETSI